MATLAVVETRAKLGLESPRVVVEVHLSSGLPKFSIVGLPEAAVKESKDRVRSAIMNSGFRFPTQRITVNLAPADLPKEGGRYDLPIALGVLAASGQLDVEILKNKEFVGELALSGKLRCVDGALPVAMQSKKNGVMLFLPIENADEAALVEDVKLVSCESLAQVVEALMTNTISFYKRDETLHNQELSLDMSDIKGQFQAKRALIIAAAGGHHMLMIGPPGTGKTMLASRLPTLLPPLEEQEALQVAALYSISSLGFDLKKWRVPPFRSPHHTISGAALVGGGTYPRPGEISLSHRGILFLDELAEFSTKILDQMRQPLESGIVHISRAANRMSFPARFQLIAAMNPLEKNGKEIGKFSTKISAPFLDRMDIQIEVPLPKRDTMQSETGGESSYELAKKILKARSMQISRNKVFLSDDTMSGDCLNSQLPPPVLDKVCILDDSSKRLLQNVIEQLNLSNRAYHRILKVARTIADVDASECIASKHIAEAVSYRILDRNNNG